MSTLREAAEKALALADEYAQAAAKARLESLYGTSKSYTAECVKDEAACREALRAELAKPDAPQVQDGWQLVPVEPTPQMVAAYLGSNRDYWQIVDEKPTVLGKWRNGTPEEAVAFAYASMLAAAPRPAPAEPQVAERGLRELLAGRIAGAMLYHDDGELQDNSAHPCIDFLRDSAETIKQKLMERAIAGLENLTNPPTPTPQPAGGEPQPAAQQEQAGERKPLTDEQIDRHSIAAVDCPPSSTVILVSSLRRLLGITATKGDRHD